jgi:rhodanese-related sulfurtransferase
MTTVSPTELQQRLTNGGCQLIDVREPVEYAEGHLPGSKLMPLGSLEQHSAELDKEAPLVLVCKSGMRSAQAQAKLQALGFHNVVNLAGGLMAWAAAGNALAGGRKGLPLMQQVQLTIGLGILLGVVLTLTVDIRFVFLCAIAGCGLTLAGSTGWCGLALLMAKMPWNKIPPQLSQDSPNKSCCA